MPDPIDTRVSPALHAQNVKEVEGYDDDTAALLAPTENAFSTAYLGIVAVHEAREAAKRNPTLNEAAAIIQTDDFARKHLNQITRTFDSTRGTLVKTIAAYEQQLSTPLESKAAATLAGEIRAFARELPTEKRVAFIQKAIADGDHTTASAVLGAPPYLSGLQTDSQKTFTRMWHEKASPEVAKRLKALKGAKQLIEQRAGLVFVEIEKAVGAPPHKARALREAKTAAEKAFLMAGC